MRANTVEYYVASHFGWRQNLIVPNITAYAWLPYHECDLVVVTPAGYVTEVEIKVSRNDILKDKKKRHKHDQFTTIKYLFFAVPLPLKDYALEHIPKNAGLLTVDEHKVVRTAKAAARNKLARAITPKQRLELYRLAAMRTWTLKRKLLSNVEDKG